MARSLLYENVAQLAQIEPQTLNSGATASDTTGWIDATDWDQIALQVNIGEVSAGGSIIASVNEATDSSGTGSNAIAAAASSAMTTSDKMAEIVFKTRKMTEGYTHLNFTLTNSAAFNVVVCATAMGYNNDDGPAEDFDSSDVAEIVKYI